MASISRIAALAGVLGASGLTPYTSPVVAQVDMGCSPTVANPCTGGGGSPSSGNSYQGPSQADVAAWQAATGRYPQAIASEFIVTTKNFAQIMISAMAYSAELRAAAESRDQLARMDKDRLATNSPPQNPGETALDCGLETSLRSEKFDRPTRVEFINKLQIVIQLFWLNYEGQRVFYNSLPPGKSYVQQTYVTHPWVATNAAGGCLSIYQPSSTPRTVILH